MDHNTESLTESHQKETVITIVFLSTIVTFSLKGFKRSDCTPLGKSQHFISLREIQNTVLKRQT